MPAVPRSPTGCVADTAPPCSSRPPPQQQAEDEAEVDIFAETPPEAKAWEQEQKRAQQGAAAAVRRAGQAGLQDAWDDPEGYYNFAVGEVLDGRYEASIATCHAVCHVLPAHLLASASAAQVFAAHGRGVFSTVLRARDLQAPLGPGVFSEVAIKVIRANETMTKAAEVRRSPARAAAPGSFSGPASALSLAARADHPEQAWCYGSRGQAPRHPPRRLLRVPQPHLPRL